MGVGSMLAVRVVAEPLGLDSKGAFVLFLGIAIWAVGLANLTAELIKEK
jgi:hypothetical protein